MQDGKRNQTAGLRKEGGIILTFALLTSASVFLFVIGMHSYLTRSRLQEALEPQKIDFREYTARISTALKEILDFEALEARYRTAGFKISFQIYLIIWKTLVLASITAPMILNLPGIVTALIIPAAVLIPKVYIDARYRKNRLKFKKDFVNFIEMLHTGISGGASMHRVLNWIVETTDDPLKMKRILEDINSGVPLSASLDSFAKRFKDADVDSFVAAIRIAETTGKGYDVMLGKLVSDIKRKRMAQLDSEIKKVEVKLIFPIVLTVLPTAFLLMLGPLVVYLSRIAFQ